MSLLPRKKIALRIAVFFLVRRLLRRGSKQQEQRRQRKLVALAIAAVIGIGALFWFRAGSDRHDAEFDAPPAPPDAGLDAA